jgi:endonuclease VIII
VPEGDTIHRTAIRMRPVLAGHVLTRFEAPRLVGDRPSLGDRIDDVEARGKHLLVHFGGGLTLRTHMKMTGSWHLYRESERWRKGAHLARAVVGADSGWVAVCFQAPVVETYHRGLGDPAALASLGPDLSTEAPDLDLAVTRAGQLDPATELGDALLDQRIAAGIGNVYKSDVCWLHRVDPSTPLASVPPDRLRAMFDTAHRLLVANLGRSRRMTHGDGLAVYGRRGQPCPRCGTPVRMRRQGPMARSTYWCPDCQPPIASATG